jgi:hypothetical protein
MRVLMLADPVLLEQPGGLRTQVRETHAALCALRGETGIEAGLATTLPTRPGDWDLVHAFGTGGAIAGAIEAAADAGIAVVLTPRLSPAWSLSNGTRARVADRMLGEAACELDSNYAQIRRSLGAARLVLAQGLAERDAICDGFLLEPEKVMLLPPGVAARYFSADPVPFRERIRVKGRFALMVGQVTPRANQLAVARALAELALPLVVVGESRERDCVYQQSLCALRTVRCLGALAHDDPLLASAYAAASVLVLGAGGAGAALTAAEALAAGTPVVGMAALLAEPFGTPVATAPCDDAASLQRAVSDLLERPPLREALRAPLRGRTWSAVASKLAQCYRVALAAACPAPVSES